VPLKVVYHELRVLTSQKPISAVVPPRGYFPVFLRRGTTDFDVFIDIFFEEKDYNLELPFTPQFIVDCGGNIGLAAVYFKMKYPDAQVVTIEPETNNYELLLKNIALFDGIEPIKAGVWSKTTKLIVKNYTGNDYEFVTEETGLEDTASPDNYVAAVGLNDILSQRNKGTIDLLKIDIEGAERELFRTNYEFWLSRTRAIVLEIHNHFNLDCSRNLEKALSQFRFKEVWFEGDRKGCGVGFYLNEGI
jgi:FkbM family methyltransferase